ncbi:MAG: MarR family winged helix-turn-helix transcriptional regulator [Nostocoides sp.]
MPDRHTLLETERVTGERLAHLTLDFEAANGVLSIHRAANAARAHLTATVLRPNGLTWTGFLVLWIVWIWKSMETRHIAESVGISKATLTGVTNTLVDRGLVRRVPSTQDRRLVSLELTPKGITLLDRLFPTFNHIESDIVRDFDPTELNAMTTSLRKVITTIEEMDVTA